MKLLTSGLVLVFGLFLAGSMIDAKESPSPTGPNRNASTRARSQPRAGLKRLSSGATPHTSSPAPGRGRSMSRVAPTQRLARRQKSPNDTTTNTTETNRARRRVGSRELAKDAPRIAMTRALGKRLSQIDKIRDKALEAGDLGLLELADELELRARRKFDDSVARMDQRRELGKPGVGPPVLLPTDDPTAEPDTSDVNQSSEPTSLPETEVHDESNLADVTSSDSATNSETEAASPETTQE